MALTVFLDRWGPAIVNLATERNKRRRRLAVRRARRTSGPKAAPLRRAPGRALVAASSADAAQPTDRPRGSPRRSRPHRRGDAPPAHAARRDHRSADRDEEDLGVGAGFP